MNKQKTETIDFFNALINLFGEASTATETAKVILNNCINAYDNAEVFTQGQTVYELRVDNDGQPYVKEETLTGQTTLSDIQYYKDNLGELVFLDRDAAEAMKKNLEESKESYIF